MRPSAILLVLLVVSQSSHSLAQAAPPPAPDPPPAPFGAQPPGRALTPAPTPPAPAPEAAPAPAPASAAAPAQPPAAAPPPTPEPRVEYGEPPVWQRTGYPHPEPVYTMPLGHGAFTHDGFYLRLSAGALYAIDSAESSCVPKRTTCTAALVATLSSAGIATEVALGGTISDGLVVGGGVFSHVLFRLSTSDAKLGGASVGGAHLDRVVFVVYGALADYYFDPHGGFHVQGSIGLGMVVSGSGQLDDGRTIAGSHTATGPGLAVGMGYEWWIAAQWSAGLMLRGSGAVLSGADDRNLEWDHTIVAPALVGTVTYH